MAVAAHNLREDLWPYLVNKARSCSRTYAELVYKDEEGTPLTLAPIHESIHIFREENQFGIIELPREHGKTTTMLEIITHEIGNNPNIRSKVVCSTDAIATGRVRAAKEILESPIYHSIFPHIKPGMMWAETRFTVDRDFITPEPTLEGFGVNAKGTGGRCDDLHLDDVDDEEVVSSEVKRKRNIDRVLNVWLNTVTPTGRVFVYSTPWHEGDTTGCLKELGWPVLRFPVKDMKPVWDARWNVEALEARKAQIGSLAFARGYELIPMSSESAPIDGAWFGYWYEDGSLPKMTGVVIAVDPTISMEPTADWTAIGIGTVDENHRVYLREVIRKRFTFTQITSQLETLADRVQERYGLEPFIGIEDVAFQKAIPQTMKQDSRHPIVGLKANKSKFIRASRLAVHIENGRVFLKGDGQKVHQEHKIVYDECVGYPAAAHDDCVDMLGYLVEMALRFSGGSIVERI